MSNNPTTKNMLIRKYELLEDDTIQYKGVKLHRIKALVDIPKQRIEKGMLGGYIEADKNLSHDDNSWVADEAKVYGSAYVCGTALVKDNAIVSGKTTIIDSALIADSAQVLGHCLIAGRATVRGNAVLNARVSIDGGTVIQGTTTILCDWNQHQGVLTNFHSDEIEDICHGVGSTYAMIGKRLKLLRKRLDTVVKHLEGIKDYTDIVKSDIDGMLEEGDDYQSMQEQILRTSLLIRNTKDKMFESIEDYRPHIARLENEEKTQEKEEPDPAYDATMQLADTYKFADPAEDKPDMAAPSQDHDTDMAPEAPKPKRHRRTAAEIAAARKATQDKARAYARNKKKSKSEEIIEKAMENTNVRKNLKP